MGGLFRRIGFWGMRSLLVGELIDGWVGVRGICEWMSDESRA